jgi:hypothetical protein
VGKLNYKKQFICQEVNFLAVSCKARCLHQKNGKCQLDDHRVKGIDVEFSDEFDPASSCDCFSPVNKKKAKKKKKKER